jgi:CheY-like chemotaxis protein
MNAQILIVDDNPSGRLLLGDLLEARGYRVETAENGVEALQSIAERRPDLVLLDLLLPDMDGFEVCRRMRSEHPGPRIPVLILSGLDSDAQATMTRPEPVDGMLTKPLDLGRLEALLQTLLSPADAISAPLG